MFDQADDNILEAFRSMECQESLPTVEVLTL